MRDIKVVWQAVADAAAAEGFAPDDDEFIGMLLSMIGASCVMNPAKKEDVILQFNLTLAIGDAMVPKT